MKTLLLSLLLVYTGLSTVRAQVSRQDCTDSLGTLGAPQRRTFYSFQDCHGAIPLCALNNRFGTGYICGNGRISNEVPTSSCLRQNENNSTWYTFKSRTAGKLKFTIVPLDMDTINPGGSNQGDTDYDWALYRLPAGTQADIPTCAQLTQNGSWEVACNYSGLRGATGMADSTNGKFENEITVNVGETFVLVVDNFTGGNLIGYKILFYEPATHPGLADIRLPGIKPRFLEITSVPNCTNTLLNFKFNKDVSCNDVLADGTLRIVNLSQPNKVYSLDTLFATPFCFGGTASQYALRYSPAEISDSMALILTNEVKDLCGDTLRVDTLRFKIKPFIRIEPFVGGVRQDSVCAGNVITLKAKPDESLGARIDQFRYQFFYYDAVRRITTGRILFNDSLTLDSINIISFKQKLQQKTVIYVMIKASSTTSACQDSALTKITINPVPNVQILPQYAACFGDTINVAAGNVADTSAFTYEWRSKVSGRRFPQLQQFVLKSDTVDDAGARARLVLRARNDDLTLQITYKPQYGACQGGVLKTKLLVGARLRPLFLY